MTEKNIKRIHLIYGVILSCLILVTGACFIWACLSIYQSGEKPFSRESVGLWFSKIQIPVYLCLGGILGGGILSLMLPLPEAKERALLDRKQTLKRLLRCFSEADFDAEIKTRLKKERAMRAFLVIGSVAFCVIAATVSLLYTCNPDNYTLENLNGDILRAVLIVMGGSAIALALCYACKILFDSSVSRELAAVKEGATAAPPIKRVSQAESQTSDAFSWKKWAIRGIILVVGIVFVLLGISNGGAEDVLGKAIRICTECIGLG